MIEVEFILQGQLRRFPLPDGETKVGRGPDCSLQLAEPGVSKSHAILRVDGDSLFVRDLGSTNGTYLDGQPVGGEEIEVAESATMRFASVSVWRDRGGSTAPGESILLPTEKDFNTSFTYMAGKQEIADDARDRIVGVLSELFELLASNSSRTEICDSACAFVAECLDADRVVLLQDTGRPDDLEFLAQWVRGAARPGELRLSTTIVGKVLRNRETVLVGNALDDPDLQGQESIVALDLRSAMAAPLFDNQQVLGILYVDCSRPNVRYGMDDLQVLTAVANGVAIKLRTLSLEKEIRTAARIQLSMLPASIEVPEGWQLEAHLVMTREVGGDLYHCLPRKNGHILLAVGDVAGKGVPASLAMAATIVLLRSLNEMDTDLEQIGPHLDQQLLHSLAAEQFVTLFLADLDPETGQIQYLNAGHEPALLLRHSSGEIETIDSTGRPMALLPGGTFDVETVQLEPGDTLAIFSDGIPEATVSGDAFFGVEPLYEILKAGDEQTLPKLRREIVGQVDSYLGDAPASDDVTLMLLRRDA